MPPKQKEDKRKLSQTIIKVNPKKRKLD